MMPYRLGLTGSIGMGKSTTAGFFVAAGVPVWDADAAVHRMYSVGGAAVADIAARWPQALSAGAIDRSALKKIIAADRTALTQIEQIVHPMVAQDRADFLAGCTTDIAVFDIPLLFEKGTEADMDATLLVTAPPALQRARVLARDGMTAAQFETILSRQMPDVEKRQRAMHIVETLSLEAVSTYVTALIVYIREQRHA
jgi:dephospho-CoA kinase